MAVDAWEMLPLVGLGALRFDERFPEPESLIHSYGEVESDGPLAPSGNEIFETLKQSLGEEEALRAMEALAEENVDLRPRRRVIYNTGVYFDLLEGAIEEILCDPRAERLRLGEVPIMASDPMPALIALETANGEAPYLKKTDCYFAKLHVTAFEFLMVRPLERPRPTDPNQGEGLQKTIGWRKSARNLGEDLSQHVQLTLRPTPQ